MAEGLGISWAPADRPTRWTKEHLTADEKTTFCGLRIPSTSEVYNYGHDFGNDPCRRCEVVAGCLCEPHAEPPTAGWNPRCPVHGGLRS